MIVRGKPSVWELFFVLRGSIVVQILPQIGFVTALSLLLVALRRSGLTHFTPITPLALSVIGAALAIFAAFRNAAAYDRWWEARKLLGLVVIDARSLARQALNYIAVVPGVELQRRIAQRCIAFMYVLRDFLRKQPIGDDTARWLLPDERASLAVSHNPPTRLLEYFSADIATALASGRLLPEMARALEDRVQGLMVGFASAERTRGTPMPFVYTLLVHRTAYAFCFLLGSAWPIRAAGGRRCSRRSSPTPSSASTRSATSYRRRSPTRRTRWRSTRSRAPSRSTSSSRWVRRICPNRCLRRTSS